jgi:hypothetical protein
VAPLWYDPPNFWSLENEHILYLSPVELLFRTLTCGVRDKNNVREMLCRGYKTISKRTYSKTHSAARLAADILNHTYTHTHTHTQLYAYVHIHI